MNITLIREVPEIDISNSKRIMIIGSPGSGKSTLALSLSQASNLPVIHLDQLYWRANWVQPPYEEWLAHLNTELLAKEWIIDGNFNSTMELRMSYADTIVFLDISRWTCIWSIVKRWFCNIGSSRHDQNEDCKEEVSIKMMKLLIKLIKGAYNFKKKNYHLILERCEKYNDKNLIIINKRSEMRNITCITNKVMQTVRL